MNKDEERSRSRATSSDLRQAIEDTVHGNLDKSNSKLFGMGYTSTLAN